MYLEFPVSPGGQVWVAYTNELKEFNSRKPSKLVNLTFPDSLGARS